MKSHKQRLRQRLQKANQQLRMEMATAARIAVLEIGRRAGECLDVPQYTPMVPYSSESSLISSSALITRTLVLQ